MADRTIDLEPAAGLPLDRAQVGLRGGARSAVPAVLDGAAAGSGARMLRRLRSWWPFLTVVVLPTLLAGLYFGVAASDRYVATAQFVLRSAERAVPTGLGALLQSTGLGGAQDDAQVVGAFMRSRAALAALEEMPVPFSTRMMLEGIDPLSRWPNLMDERNFEGLFDYFGRRVHVVQDVATGVWSLSVEAFTPGDAREIAMALFEHAENFVNRMNERAMRDALSLAAAEVSRAEQRIAENQQAFRELRSRQGIVGPEAGITTQLTVIVTLSEELASVQSEAARLERVAPRSPQLEVLRSRIAALEAQIAAERAKLAGPGGGLSDSIASFETLVLEQKFANEALLSARSAYELARTEALRKQRYLELVSEPRAPDDAREPRRVRLILTVLSGSLLLYAVGWLLWANAREHRS